MGSWPGICSAKSAAEKPTAGTNARPPAQGAITEHELEPAWQITYDPAAILVSLPQSVSCLVDVVLDFEVQRFTRVCAKTDRELAPGETFFSYLVREGSETVRHDVANDAWQGAPEDCLAWWSSEVPDPKSKKMHWAPHDVMLHYFTETEGKESEADVRYILALLMVRRRIFRLEETEIDEDGVQHLLLFCSRNEHEYNVPVVEVGPERIQEIQTLLATLLVDAGNR